jgi:hypothetical protein
METSPSWSSTDSTTKPARVLSNKTSGEKFAELEVKFEIFSNESKNSSVPHIKIKIELLITKLVVILLNCLMTPS